MDAVPALDRTTLTEAERRVVERLPAALREVAGDDLVAVWLYGSTARGEERHDESDVDLLVLVRDARRWADPLWRSAYALEEEERLERRGRVWLSLTVRDVDDWAYGNRIERFFNQEVERDKVVLG